jgi:hypothetical protein
MDEMVVKELDDIELIVSHWKDDYMKYVTGKNDEYLFEEFLEELDTHVSPKVRRLYENKYIDYNEMGIFMDRCYKHLMELREAIDEARL